VEGEVVGDDRFVVLVNREGCREAKFIMRKGSPKQALLRHFVSRTAFFLSNPYYCPANKGKLVSKTNQIIPSSPSTLYNVQDHQKSHNKPPYRSPVPSPSPVRLANGGE
jgi:hypothetical protein